MRKILFLFLGISTGLFAQNPTYPPTAVSPIANPNIVEINHADTLWADQTTGYTWLRGNVQLRQNNVLVFCKLAIKNDILNVVEAYEKVRIIQGDSTTLTGDSALYYGETRQARIYGKTVTLNDRTATLKTRRLEYDMNTRVGRYTTGGTLIDKKSVLTSKEGYYNTATKMANFYKDVQVKNPETDLFADSLRYSTLSKDAYFIAPTTVVSKNQNGTTDTLLAKAGSYNLNNKVSNFFGRSTVRTESIDLTGDTLAYDTPTGIGIARGRVVAYVRKDSTYLTGDIGRYFNKTGIARIYGNALMQRFYANDSLLLSSDTLISEKIRRQKDTTRRLTAIGKVLIFKKDFQGKCDSLVYSVGDSLMSFYRKPVLWNATSQSEADTILVRLVNNKAQTMTLLRKAFVIARDSVGFTNQMKGRKITVKFGAGGAAIEQALVEGNAESIYFVLNDAKKLVGMNYVQAARMRIGFKNSAVSRIAFLGNPDGMLRPPREITSENRMLDGYVLRTSERPTRERVKRLAPGRFAATRPLGND